MQYTVHIFILCFNILVVKMTREISKVLQCFITKCKQSLH